MHRRRILIAILTFLSGLYFVLDYVIPPVVPVAAHTGVVVGTRIGVVRLENGAVFPLAGGIDITVQQRDTTGETQRVAKVPRLVSPGNLVSVRRAPVAFGSLSGRVMTTEAGARIDLQPGERLYPVGGDRPVATPSPGDTVVPEVRDVRVASIDRGAVTLIERGKRRVRPVGPRTVLMRLDRYDPAAEVQIPDLKVGDTVRMGPASGFPDQRDTAAQFNLIITSMAFGMGLLSLGSAHARALRRRSVGWYASVFFFAAVVIGVVAGQFKYSDPGTSERAFSDLIVLQILAAVGSAIFSLLAFYMASAAYRAFRVRTLEAGLMMASALIVMLGQTPFGTYLTSWMGESLNALWLPNVAAWILRVPTTAIFRGLIFGIMMGAIGTALRYWLSLERSAAMGDVG